MTEKEYRAALAKAEQFDVVRIRWRDSSHVALGWAAVDDYVESMEDALYGLEESTGYFIASNTGFVLLALNLRQWRPSENRKPSITEAMIVPHEAIRTFEIIVAGKDLDRSFGDEDANDVP